MSLQVFCCLAVLIFLELEVKGQKQCPDGFQEHNQSCYKVVISHATWIHAREFCRAIGAHLVSINSVEEEHAVEATIASLNLGATALRSFWIGATDLSEKGIFVWMHDSSMVTYTNWQPGEPNNFGGKENCAEMFEDQLKIRWNDNNCSEKTDFICETSTS